LFFRCSLACTYGYAPDLKRCSACGREIEPGEPGRFFLEQGLLHCRACAGHEEAGIRLPGSSRELMGEILEGGPGNWAELQVAGDEQRRTCRVLDRFVRYHTGLVWDAGRFRQM
jgi:DNA repair protein RecO (recombination protein O)